MNRVDYRPRKSHENVDPEWKETLNFAECAELCSSYNNCSFFYYNIKSFCDLFEYCNSTFEPILANNSGSTYQKRILGKIICLLRFVSFIKQNSRKKYSWIIHKLIIF